MSKRGQEGADQKKQSLRGMVGKNKKISTSQINRAQKLSRETLHALSQVFEMDLNPTMLLN